MFGKTLIRFTAGAVQAKQRRDGGVVLSCSGGGQSPTLITSMWRIAAALPAITHTHPQSEGKGAREITAASGNGP